MLAHPSWTPALSQHPRHTTHTHSLSAPSLLLPFELSTLKKLPVCFQVKISTTRQTAAPPQHEQPEERKVFLFKAQGGR